MGREGYIKLYRKLLDNPIVTKDADHLAIWIYLLLEARKFEKDAYLGGKKITLQPGQLTTGRKQISEKLRVEQSKVQRVLKLYETEHLIEQQTTSKNRLISIVGWDKYQEDEQQNEPEMNSQCTTDGQPVHTPKESKKEKKKERNRIPPSREDVEAYITEKGFDIDLNVWFDFYEAKGWMIGKNRMKDWQASIRYWGSSNRKERQGADRRTDYGVKSKKASIDRNNYDYEKFFE